MTVEVDRVSLLVEVSGEVQLSALEAAVLPHGLTLRIDLALHGSRSVASWIAQGLPGTRDPFRDPADHPLAGLVAKMHGGTVITVHPAPRRAVGPDLIALFVGMNERFGLIERAWVRVHVEGARQPDTAPFHLESEGELAPAEEALLAAIARELG